MLSAALARAANAGAGEDPCTPTKMLRQLPGDLPRAYTMKDMKRTYVPVPGSKPKPKSKAKDTPSKVQLSQEFIGSDDDSPAETAPKLKTKTKTTIAVHGPNGATKSKGKPSKKDAATPKSQPKAKPAPKKPAPTTVVTEAQADELSTSEQTDDEVPKRDLETKLAEKDASASGSDSGNSDDSSSDSDESAANVPSPPAQAYVMHRCS